MNTAAQPIANGNRIAPETPVAGPVPQSSRRPSR
jgi:hypothetical protein